MDRGGGRGGMGWANLSLSPRRLAELQLRGMVSLEKRNGGGYVSHEDNTGPTWRGWQLRSSRQLAARNGRVARAGAGALCVEILALVHSRASGRRPGEYRGSLESSRAISIENHEARKENQGQRAPSLPGIWICREPEVGRAPHSNAAQPPAASFPLLQQHLGVHHWHGPE